MNRKGSEEGLDEKRASTRFRIQAPAIATVGNREIWAFMRDISTQAVYFRTAAGEEKPALGEFVNFLIKIPPTLSFSKPCFIRGRGRTIRFEDSDEDESGFVVEILEYDIESESAFGNEEVLD